MVIICQNEAKAEPPQYHIFNLENYSADLGAEKNCPSSLKQPAVNSYNSFCHAQCNWKK